MTNPNASIQTSSIVGTNHRKSSSLIEVHPETLTSIENVKETNERTPSTFNEFYRWIQIYLGKFYGLHQERPKRASWQECVWSFIGGFMGIVTIALLHFKLVSQHQLLFIIGSFGASAIIVFSTPQSPLAQPRSLIFGHLIGALCGCIIRVAIFQYARSTACALAVAVTIVITQVTETPHPPAGATALIAVTTQPILPWANFQFILMPALTGACIMLIVALIVNNMAPQRTYPCFWW